MTSHPARIMVITGPDDARIAFLTATAVIASVATVCRIGDETTVTCAERDWRRVLEIAGETGVSVREERSKR